MDNGQTILATVSIARDGADYVATVRLDGQTSLAVCHGDSPYEAACEALASALPEPDEV